MKHYIKSNFYEDAFEFEPDYTDTIDYHKIRLAEKYMRRVIEVLDSMNEETFHMFDQNCYSDVNTEISDNINALNQFGILRK